MITQATAQLIWTCYREIEAGKKLLKDMEETRKQLDTMDKHAPSLRDCFGRRQHLELGIPCGENGHRLLKVDPSLAESVIRAHIANKEAELKQAQEVARIELDP